MPSKSGLHSRQEEKPGARWAGQGATGGVWMISGFKDALGLVWTVAWRGQE